MKGDIRRQEKPRAGQNGDHEGRQIKAKSRPEWRSCRETNEGRQMKAEGRSRRETNEGWRSRRETNEGRVIQEQARMGIMQGDK